jgi:uncharacterized protein YigE (DUF2233 family)
MKKYRSQFKYIALVLTLFLIVNLSFKRSTKIDVLSYTVNPKTQNIQLFWKDDKGNIIKNFKSLNQFVKSKKQALLFACNASMYTTEYGPVGLFIQNGKVLKSLNKSDGKYNFTWKPNGVFYINNDKQVFVCETDAFKNDGKIKYATQSGPMLVINGKIHVGFDKSTVKCVRNGVGILPDGKVLFAMSKSEVTFYEFAKYFLDLGCKNALYFDGAISKSYLPSQKWTNQDGQFGVMVGVVE